MQSGYETNDVAYIPGVGVGTKESEVNVVSQVDGAGTVQLMSV